MKHTKESAKIMDHASIGARSREVHGAMTTLLVKIVQEAQTARRSVWFVEDVHKLDPPSWGVLAEIAQKVKPIVLVMSARILKKGEEDDAQIAEWSREVEKISRLKKVSMINLGKLHQVQFFKLMATHTDT